MNLEANFAQLCRINDTPAVKDECWLLHVVVKRSPVELLEFVPFSGNDDGLCVGACLDCILAHSHLLFD